MIITYRVEEIRRQLEARRPYWDKTHPEYPKGIPVVDYMSLFRLPKATPEETTRHQRTYEIMSIATKDLKTKVIFPSQ